MEAVLRRFSAEVDCCGEWDRVSGDWGDSEWLSEGLPGEVPDWKVCPPSGFDGSGPCGFTLHFAYGWYVQRGDAEDVDGLIKLAKAMVKAADALKAALDG